METEISSDMCRICFKKSPKLSSLYNGDEDESPRLMLEKLTGIQFENENELVELPKQICRNCICELNLSFHFREKALQAQSFIDNYLIKAGHLKEPKLTQITIANEDFQDTTNDIDCIENKQEIPIECEEFVYLEDECYDEIETTANSLPNEIEYNKIDTTIITSKTPIAKYEKNLLKPPLKIVDSTDLAENKESIKVLSKRGRKPKAEEKIPKEGRKSHVCYICGNVFEKRGRLTEHLRRHSTEAKYVCEICNESFLLREALRRHMFQHLGGKPYKCDHCSRTFFYESVKKAHEAIHNGSRAYKCENCSKTFAYPHALKAHMLIHNQIKQFYCKYCKKDFRLSHHMKQHQETKSHQNAVKAAMLMIKNNERTIVTNIK